MGGTLPELTYFNTALAIERDFPGLGLGVNGATYALFKVSYDEKGAYTQASTTRS
jgi:hypothetical protein